MAHHLITALPQPGSATLGMIAVATLIITASVGAGPVHAIDSKYGCVAVTTESLNIRDRNSSRRGEVVAVAKRGEVLAKRGPTCPIRRFWCPVKNSAGVEGWASKEFIRDTECK